MIQIAKVSRTSSHGARVVVPESLDAADRERLLCVLRDHGARFDGTSWSFPIERAAAIGARLEAAGFRVEIQEVLE